MPELTQALRGRPTRSSGGTTGRCAAGLLAAALVAGCTSPTASRPTTTPTTPSPSPTSATPSPTPPAATSGGLEAVPGVAARLAPSVVTILTEGGTGSGVVYTADGVIVTNEHVVGGATDVQVAFADGQRVPGRVTATDRITDLALVQADRRDLPPARFQPQLPVIGSLAVVIGSPLGFQNSVTAGVVSGLHRDIPGSAGTPQPLVDLMQTDAPISPGNSGGAVANAAGEVIGISEAYIPPQAGAVALGFAIPAATVLDVVEQLQRTGRARHAFAGLSPAPITAEIAAQLGLPNTDGVIVRAVVVGGPADRGGVRPGDIITAVDREPVRTPEDFLAVLRAHDPGDKLALTIRTPTGESKQVTLTLADRPQASGG